MLERRASVVEYLYPNGKTDVPSREVKLQLPLRVAVAFAPTSRNPAGTDAFSEVQQRELLKRVVAAFQNVPEVQSVDILPTSALRPGGGFPNLEQAASTLDANIIALVSYDQVQFEDPGMLSFLYVTVVGAFVVPGNLHETQTLLDASVFDVASHDLLFTGSGSSVVDTRSAMVGSERVQRETSASGFDKAADDLIASLNKALTVFREHAKNRTLRGLGTPSVQVVSREPSASMGGGSGALGPWDLGGVALLAIAGSLVALRRR
jgi:rhombotail lipoprotein